jgi:hypothetical protein
VAIGTVPQRSVQNIVGRVIITRDSTGFQHFGDGSFLHVLLVMAVVYLSNGEIMLFSAFSMLGHERICHR